MTAGKKKIFVELKNNSLFHFRDKKDSKWNEKIKKGILKAQLKRISRFSVNIKKENMKI
jgi:hypothetical protein